MAAGLIDLEMGGTKKTVLPGGDTLTEMKPVGYMPETRAVDAGTETVSGQMDKLLKNESEYITRGRNNATMEANRRGLINSSMAIGAAEGAAIDRAMPIAAADAQVYDTAARENLGFKNQALQFGAGASNNAGQVNTGEANAFAKARQAGAIEKELVGTRTDAESRLIGNRADAERETLAAQGEQQRQTLAQSGAQDVQMQTLRGDQAKAIADVEAQYKTLIQASASSADLFKTVSAAIAAIMADTNTSAEQKQAGVNKMGESLRAGLAVAGGIANLDLVDLLDFGV